MAHAVEDHLRDRAAALQRLEPGFVIDRLGQAQQSAALVERRSPRAANGRADCNGPPANGKRALMSLACVADRPQLVGCVAAGRLDQRARPRAGGNRYALRAVRDGEHRRRRSPATAAASSIDDSRRRDSQARAAIETSGASERGHARSPSRCLARPR